MDPKMRCGRQEAPHICSNPYPVRVAQPEVEPASIRSKTTRDIAADTVNDSHEVAGKTAQDDCPAW